MFILDAIGGILLVMGVLFLLAYLRDYWRP